MTHKIAEVIIENGQIKHVNKKLPSGRIKAHLIYDEEEEKRTKNDIQKIIRETSGIYKSMDTAAESKKLRKSWERNAKK
jgi:hypothetical protein